MNRTQTDSGQRQPMVGHEEKRYLIFLCFAAVIWCVGWCMDISAAWVAGGHPAVGFLSWHDPRSGASWRDHGMWVPWRLVGANDSLSHLRFWLIVVIELVGLFVLPIVVKTWLTGYSTWLLRFRWGRKKNAVVRESHFASAHEVAPLLVKRPELGRIILGDFGRGRRVAAGYLHSTMTVAPTGAGKTTRLLIPALAEWDGPAIVVTTKDDIYESTAATRRGVGEISLYDVLSLTRWAETRTTWNPIPGCRDLTEALRVADLFAASSADSNRGVEGGMSYWDDNGKKLFTVCFYAAAWQGLGLDTVRKWVDMQDIVAIKTALLRTPQGWRPKTKQELERDNLPWPPQLSKGQPIPESYLVYGDAYQSLMSLLNKPQQELQTVFSTAAILLKALLYPAAVASCQTSMFTTDDFLNGRSNTLYIVSPPGKSDDLIPFVCGLIMHVIHAVRDRDLAGNRLSKPLLVVLDEAANIAPLRELDQIATNDRSRGIVLLTAFQTYSQIAERWGPNKAQAIWSCHPAKVVLGGITDGDTLEIVSRLLGRKRVLTTSTSRGAGGNGTSESYQDREVFTADQLRQLPEGKAIAIVERYQPMMISQRASFDDPRLLELAKLPLVPGVSYLGAAPVVPDWATESRVSEK